MSYQPLSCQTFYFISALWVFCLRLTTLLVLQLFIAINPAFTGFLNFSHLLINQFIFIFVTYSSCSEIKKPVDKKSCVYLLFGQSYDV